MNLTDSVVYAGFWRRLAAVMIDTLIVVLLLGMLLYLISDGSISREALESDPFAFYSPGATLAVDIGFFVVVVFFWVRFLGTPGKLLLGCQIVNARTGQPLSIGRAVLRYFGYLVSAIVFLLGFIWIAIDRRKQGFHDKIAGSVVIIEDEARKSLKTLETETR